MVESLCRMHEDVCSCCSTGREEVPSDGPHNIPVITTLPGRNWERRGRERKRHGGEGELEYCKYNLIHN